MKDVYNKDNKEDYSFLNKAIQSVYPPASIFKLVVAAAILEERVIDKDRSTYDSNWCKTYYSTNQ